MICHNLPFDRLMPLKNNIGCRNVSNNFIAVEPAVICFFLPFGRTDIVEARFQILFLCKMPVLLL